MTSSVSSLSELLAYEKDLVDATQLAWRWHGAQTRKGRSNSYMSHLLQVQGLVIECNGTAYQAIAALLHDSLEDAPTPADRASRESEIGERFDQAVLQIVLDCTDTTPKESAGHKAPWHERKERFLAQLRDAEPASLLVAACDKRHNLGELVRDLRHEGPDTLARFNAGAADQIWYFESLLRICEPWIPPRLAAELDALTAELRRLAGPDA